MITIEVLMALLIFLMVALTTQIGIASWNIHRANRYRRDKELANVLLKSKEKQVDCIIEKYRAMDKYATNITWLLNFLYDRYNKFEDIDKELEKTCENLTEETSVEESKKVQNMKRALRLIKTTARVADNIYSYMNTISAQINLIMNELKKLDAEEKEEEVYKEYYKVDTSETQASDDTADENNIDSEDKP